MLSMRVLHTLVGIPVDPCGVIANATRYTPVHIPAMGIALCRPRKGIPKSAQDTPMAVLFLSLCCVKLLYLAVVVITVFGPIFIAHK